MAESGWVMGTEEIENEQIGGDKWQDSVGRTCGRFTRLPLPDMMLQFSSLSVAVQCSQMLWSGRDSG